MIECILLISQEKFGTAFRRLRPNSSGQLDYYFLKVFAWQRKQKSMVIVGESSLSSTNLHNPLDDAANILLSSLSMILPV
jgi:hypothetical protein